MRFFSVEPLQLDVTLLSTAADADVISRRTQALCSADFSKQLRFINSPTPSLPVDHVGHPSCAEYTKTTNIYQMNLAHDLSHVLNNVAIGRQSLASRMRWNYLLLSVFEIHFLKIIFMHLRRVGEICASVLYGLCNLPSPSFPFNKTRLKDLSASSALGLLCVSRH